MGRAYEEIGFVALKGHFLDKDLVDELYTQVRLFFSLPDETKAKYEIPGLAGQRGYTSFGKEHAKGRTAGDLKEFFHFGQNNPPKNGEDYPENLYWLMKILLLTLLVKKLLQHLKKQVFLSCEHWHCI